MAKVQAALTAMISSAGELLAGLVTTPRGSPGRAHLRAILNIPFRLCRRAAQLICKVIALRR